MVSYIIFRHESVEAVIIDDEKFANDEMERLAEKDFEKKFKNIGSGTYNKNYAIYRDVVKWRVETVKVLNRE